MNQDIEKVPVAEQVAEMEHVDEAIKAEYSLEPDGSIEKVTGDIEKPETE